MAACLVITVVTAQSTITTPRTPSPAATVTQTIGISTVAIQYSRPSVKGREVWGKLVPYGWNIQGFGAHNPAPWRAGANENTVVTFSHNAKVEGKEVPAGSYGLTFIINQDNTGEVILSKDYRSWGSFWYDPTHDQLRANIKIRDNAMAEMLTYDFINADKNSAEIVLNWEKKQFPVKVEFAVDEIVIANATEELKNVVGFNWQGYNSAAQYAFQNKIYVDKGLQWIETALTQQRNFNTLSTKANLLKLKGNDAEAGTIMNEALSLATEPQINAYGYQLLNQKEIEKAIGAMVLNTQRFPKSANAWDSLGEAYVTKGDKPNAIKSFKKSLSLNPTAATKANSEKFLKELAEK